MLVRQLIGPNAGNEFHMNPDDAKRAAKGGAVEIVGAPKDAPALAATKTVIAPPTPVPGKRKGGWPLGKKRGPRASRPSPSGLTPNIS